MSGRIEAWLYSTGNASQVSTSTLTLDIGGGPVTVRQTAPATFLNQLGNLKARADALVGAQAPWTFAYDATTQRVTIASNGGNFAYSLIGNLAALLGMPSTGAGASHFIGTSAPIGLIDLRGCEVEPPQDASRLDLQRYRHGRVVVAAWGCAQTFKARIWLAAADVATWQQGYIMAGKVRLTQASGGGSAYSPTNLGGYVDGWIVSSGRPVYYGQREDVVSIDLVIASARDG